MYFTHDLFVVSLAVGVFMYVMSVAVFMSGFGFYCYAFLKLPSTTQELVFLREAEKTIERHKRSTSKNRANAPNE